MNLVWLNGARLPAHEARIDPADRGFTLGDGVFETLRALDGVVLHVDLHLARLSHGAAVLGIDVPFPAPDLRRALAAMADGADAALRLTLTRGPMPRGLLPAGAQRPTLLITAAALPPDPPPARLILADGTRRNEASPLSRIKSLNYGDAILARQEAASKGADDAVLLNVAGDLAEATAAAIILCIDGQFVTPRVTDGALPGIARGRLLGAGMITEARVTRGDALRADAAILVNSLGARRVASLAGRRLDIGHEGLDRLIHETNS